MMYLEDLLGELKEKSNVCVMLSSFTNYENDFSMRDGCGNHYTKNWMDALKKLNMYKIFCIDKFECQNDCENKPQWKITLTTGKNSFTEQLDYWSNKMAIDNWWNNL